MSKRTFNKRFFILSKRLFAVNKIKLLLFSISLLFSLSITLLTTGFYFGTKEEIRILPSTYLNCNKFTFSKLENKSNDNTNFKISKKSRPTITESFNYLNAISNVYIDYNLDFFINGNVEITSDNKSIKFASIELYYFNENDIDIIVNDTFNKQFKNMFNKDSLYEIISFNFTNSYKYGEMVKEEYISVDEVFNFDCNLYVSEIRNEFKYLNNSKIYFPFALLKKYLQKTSTSKINRQFIKNYKWYDLLKNAKNNEDITSFSLNFWVFKDDVNLFFNVISSSNEYEIGNNTFDVVTSFNDIINIFMIALIVFSIISILLTFILLIFVIMSIYLKEKKNIAILKTMGESNKNITKIFLTNISIVYIISAFITIILSIIIKYFINLYAHKFINSNLICVNFLNNNFKYNFIIMLLFISFYLIIKLIVDVSIYKQDFKNIGEILREE